MRVSTNQIFQQGISNILNKQAELGQLQEQIASGKRLLRPSDDPSAMARSLDIEQAVVQTTQYQRNVGEARSRIEMQETTLARINEMLLRTRELALQANNATNGLVQRQAIAVEVEQIGLELRNLANGRDGNGDYLFGGYQGRDRPFEETRVGTASHVTYLGDQGVRFTQVGEDRQIQVTESGAEVFLKIEAVQALNAEAAAINTGSAESSPAVVVDALRATGDRYRIEFQNPPTDYRVVDQTTGVEVIAPTPYVDGEPISFDGIEVTIAGSPAANDLFVVESTAHQDVFTTLGKMVRALRTGSTGIGNSPELNAQLANTIQDLDSAIEHVSDVRSRVGARLGTLESQEIDNDAVLLQSERTQSRLTDVDMVEAISQLQRESINMQAAQQTFIQVSRLSLFEFL